MKKKLYLVTAILLAILAFSACSVQEESNYGTSETSQNEENPEQNNQTLPEDDSQDSLNDFESKSESVVENNAENNEKTKESEEQLPSTQVSEKYKTCSRKWRIFAKLI